MGCRSTTQDEDNALASLADMERLLMLMRLVIEDARYHSIDSRVHSKMIIDTEPEAFKAAANALTRYLCKASKEKWATHAVTKWGRVHAKEDLDRLHKELAAARVESGAAVKKIALIQQQLSELEG